MPGTFVYGLYPFTWGPSGLGGNCHQPPAGASCVLDFRTLAQQATAGQSAGHGLFAWAANPPGDLVSLGTGYAPTLAISNAARNELKLKLGLPALPSGATLADAIADILGPLSDPTGLSGPKPLMPNANGTMEIHLDGHSRIWSGKINAAQLLSANPTGHHNKIRDVIRADLQTADDVGKFDEALGAWLLRLGYSVDEVKQGASGKKAEYQRLMPASWTNAKKNAKSPKLPKTQLVETWPSAGAIASGQTHTWDTSVGGSGGADPWYANNLSSISGAVKCTTGTGYWSFGRCSTAVSSVDHWSECAVTISGSHELGPCSRMANGARTTYTMSRYYDGNLVRMWKWVLGGWTLLSSAAKSGAESGLLLRMQSSGSTQTGKCAGLSDLAVTDTSITGNLFGGVGIVAGLANNPQVGAVTIDDGLGGGGASKNILLLGVG